MNHSDNRVFNLSDNRVAQFDFDDMTQVIIFSVCYVDWVEHSARNVEGTCLALPTETAAVWGLS